MNVETPTFDWFERAYEERSPYLVNLAVDPRCDEIRSDPLFLDLRRRMGL